MDSERAIGSLVVMVRPAALAIDIALNGANDRRRDNIIMLLLASCCVYSTIY